MDINQLIKICNELGIKIVVSNGIVREDKGYYENYHQVEKKGDNWYYSIMNFEGRQEPELKDIKEFIDEKEAIKYYFIKILYQFYFETIFPSNNPVFEINTIEGLKSYFKKLGIIEDYYSLNVIKPQSVLAEFIDNKIVVSYIDEKNQKKFATIPLNLEDGIFEMFKLTYSLHLFKKVEKEFLQRKILTEKFNDNDIELFIK
ncbi:hypothetical protein SAMN05421736_11536 [Evansella caseinilytica]|uniref:Uncharacterized protein n=1 Tax=Evansella caseinilytica TaxID=1503961 RepID=A0A1H3TJY9_9BACI|nr:hypothetical protein [Evansella caseinilytica]SDZ50632.1 hypothetical protein SAMN05421736_11536 [Evansella caseinilytica]